MAPLNSPESPCGGLRFVKMHGLGNDFVVIDRRSQPFTPTVELVRRLADRRRGIGCDQLLLVDPGDGAADVGWRIFNADGSEAGQCGNGARCVAWLVAGGSPATIRMSGAAGTITARVREDGLVSVDMGAPDFDPAALPFDPAAADATIDDGGYTMRAGAQTLRFGAVSMGNPHVVLEVGDVAAAPVETLGPLLERHAAFADRTNVGFVERVAADRIRLRVWERGSGETMACGSGACAAVAVMRRRGAVGETVAVELPGGELTIQWPGPPDQLWMTGPATLAYEGTTATL
jgi:diaminopimelate epimerase